METVRSPKRRLELVLHGTRSMETSLIDNAVKALQMTVGLPQLIFQAVCLNFPAHYALGFLQPPYWFKVVECGRCQKITTTRPSVRLLSRQCAILNLSRPYRPPRPVTEAALLSYICRWFSHLTGQTYGPPRPLTGIALLSYICWWFSHLTGHTYGPPRPVTGIALICICRWCSYLTGSTDLHHLMRGKLCFFIRKSCSYFTGNTSL
jgi:hypothetical protein